MLKIYTSSVLLSYSKRHLQSSHLELCAFAAVERLIVLNGRKQKQKHTINSLRFEEVWRATSLGASKRMKQQYGRLFQLIVRNDFGPAENDALLVF